MPEMHSEDESRLKDLILDDLDEQERELFLQVHRLQSGCSIMGYLDEHPNEMLTVDDLAFHLQESRGLLEPTVRELVKCRLLRRMEATDTRFFGLPTDPETRRHVHELFNWQRGWHTRLARIEDLVNGHATK